MPDQFEILEAYIDRYIEDQRVCGNPARRQDIAEFCTWKNMPLGHELDRIGHLLEDYPSGGTPRDIALWRNTRDPGCRAPSLA